MLPHLVSTYMDARCYSRMRTFHRSTAHVGPAAPLQGHSGFLTWRLGTCLPCACAIRSNQIRPFTRHHYPIRVTDKENACAMLWRMFNYCQFQRAPKPRGSNPQVSAPETKARFTPGKSNVPHIGHKLHKRRVNVRLRHHPGCAHPFL